MLDLILINHKFDILPFFNHKELKMDNEHNFVLMQVNE
jgi:hypothetical protein